MSPCGCTWPSELKTSCPIHGEVRNCACGLYHPTMPVNTVLGDDLPMMAVCRLHLRHRPCRGCARTTERLASVVLHGHAESHSALRTGPGEIIGHGHLPDPHEEGP